MIITNIRVNYQSNVLGMNDQEPVFSWELCADQPDTMQHSYRVLIWQEAGQAWDSGIVDTDQSIDIRYAGEILESRKQYTVEVTVTDNHGNSASARTCFEMGLSLCDWKAGWIEPDFPPIIKEKEISITDQVYGTYQLDPVDERLHPSSYLRKEFVLEQPIRKARLYMTAHGVYKCEINGSRISDHYFAPEFTSYRKHLLYQTYDVTPFLQQGDNAIGIIIADGWWGGRTGFTGESVEYGNQHGLFLQMEIEYEDGSQRLICSDESFRAGHGPIHYSDFFIGEKYDARQKIPGWSCVGFDDSEWKQVFKVEYDLSNLCAQIGDPVQAVTNFQPERVFKAPNGDTIVDLGQNIAGYLTMKIDAPKGTVLKFEHTEVLDKEGNFFCNITGVNKDQTDFYICSGENDVYSPEFTFHGFRYVRITGCPCMPRPGDCEVVVLSSLDKRHGHFETSHAKLNRLQQNIVWSGITNMISIPTDCPQRERAGWTGDAQVFFPTMAFNRDMNTFISRWLEDMTHEQTKRGEFTHVVPYTSAYKKFLYGIYQTDTSSGWGDAGVLLPYSAYTTYGNKKLLERQYTSMKRWMEYVIREAKEHVPEGYDSDKHNAKENENQQYLWNTGWHYGDHAIPSMTAKGIMGTQEGSKLTGPVVASAYYVRSAEIMVKSAKLLVMNDDAARYDEKAARARKAFAETYITEDGKIETDLQGVYVLALAFGIVPEKLVSPCFERLVSLIEQNGNCLDTGFLSIPFLMDVLCKYGRTDLAYTLLYQEKCPSWFYEIDHGATTIWEGWNAIKPDGEIQKFSMNHAAFGCVGDWMYRTILGIQNQDTAYKKILIAPQPDDTLTWAKGSYFSMYGEISVSWKKKDQFQMEVSIPCNTTAVVMLPDGTRHETGSGTYQFYCNL